MLAPPVPFQKKLLLIYLQELRARKVSSEQNTVAQGRTR
jgi:hypothetical protein